MPAASGDLTRLMIQRNGRTQFNLHAEGNGMLTEDERDIRINTPPAGATVDQALAARSLVGTRRDVRGSATFNRQVFGNVSGTLNTELEHIEGRGLIGLGDILLEPLARNTSSDSAHAGVDAQLGQGAVALERRRQCRLGSRPHADRTRRRLPQRPRARDAHLGRPYRDRQRDPVQAAGGQCRNHTHSSGWRRSISTAAGAARPTSTPLRSAARPAPPRSTSICRSRAATAISARSAISRSTPMPSSISCRISAR